MSTYLQLCSALRQAASDSGTGPTAVTGQTGELARYVTWIDAYWTELQQLHDDWFWMRRSFTVQTVASDGEYAYTDCTDTTTSTAIARFARWHKDWFQCYLTSSGAGAEYRLTWVPWDAFKSRYRYGTQTDGPPQHVSMDPSLKFCLGPKPDAIYTVTGDFQLGPQILSADGDIPEMPTKFHRLIVYGALLKYGLHSASPGALQTASIEGGPLMAALIREQRPAITRGASLA